MMLNSQEFISLSRFCDTFQVEISFIHTLCEHGLCEIMLIEEEYFIAPEQLDKLEKLVRLHHDININLEGLDVILHLLEKIETLQTEVKQLKNKLNSYRQI
jgi:hypothetical protein